jgi:selenocysteine lyase/cysteine desulfurase
VTALPRRRFIAGSGAVAAGAVLGPLSACSDDQAASDPSTSASSRTPAPFDPSDWASVRDQLPLRRDLAHFAAFVFATTPRPVADAIERHRQGLDEDPSGYLEAHEAELDDAVRRAAAEHLGATPGDIALTDSTTMGLAVVYGGLRLSPGDEVLTTEHDFFSTHEALRLAAARSGATVRRVSLYDDPSAASVDAIVGRLLAGVTDATRAVAVTWTHSSTGVKLPIRAIADALDARGGNRPLLCVDAVHALGVETDPLPELGCDVLVAGTHKWLFGPRGTGIVWANDTAWAAMDPVIPPFEGASFQGWLDGQPPARTAGGTPLTPGGYHTFEHRWALADAFQLHLDIGPAAVRDRTIGQATQLKEALADVRGVRVVTPSRPELSCGIVCLETEGEPFQLLEPLREQGYTASVTPYRERYLRLGPSIATTPDEVAGVAEALAGVV